MTTMALLARGLDYAVGNKRILDQVDFAASYGEVTALVGPNGAGKSTLLSVFTGDLSPDVGTMELDGQSLANYSTLDLARRRSVLLQQNQVSFPFSGLEVIAMGRHPWRSESTAEEDERVINAAIADTDSADLVQLPYPVLSGGEKSRVCLARVLAQDTPIVLLDEPTAALDLRHQEAVLQLARKLAGQGRAVVVVIHDLSLAAAYADQVTVLHHGRNEAAGPPQEVLTEKLISEVYQTPVRVWQDPDCGLLIVPRRQAGT